MSNFYKTFLGFIVYALTIFVVSGAGAFWWVSSEFNKPGPLEKDIFFVVNKGEGVKKIAENLTYEGALGDLAHQTIFEIGVRLSGAGKRLQAGEYLLEAHISPRRIMEKMRDGDIFERRITIPEGLTSYEVDQIVSQIKDIKIIPSEPSAEGILLPGTYDYKSSDTNAGILKRMTDAHARTMSHIWPKRNTSLPFSTEREALILASIVEKETGVASERRRIAGVFVNRLRQGIPLQTDPTVIYAITKGRPQNNGQGPLGRRLLLKDLEIDSPYNTYRRAGLPPGPICNPGRAAIEAVLNPEEHSFIYFVADGTGGHVFAATLEEHNKNVAQWREIRRKRE